MSADRRVIDVDPDITEATFVAFLRERRSPAAGAAPAVYRYAVNRRVSPSYLLAVFAHESSYGTAGTATITHSWGNTRRPSFGVPDIGIVAGRSGFFSRYPDWEAGGISTVARLVEHAPYRGKRTVKEITPIWAPSTDLNDPDGYANDVLLTMALLDKRERQQRKEEPTVNYTVVDKLTPYNTSGPRGHQARAVVWHVAEGTEAGVTSWFHNPNSGASTHYLVTKDGRAIRYVDEDVTPWANGKVQRPALANPVVADIVASGINPNRLTISVETERYHRDRLAADSPMGRTLVALTRDIMIRHSIPIDDNHVLGHNELDGVDRPNCPGDIDWDGLLAALAGAAPTPAPSPVVVPVTGADERRLLLDWVAERVPVEVRGELVREGEVSFEEGRWERLAIYEKQRFHRYHDASEAFLLDGPTSFTALSDAGKVRLY